MPLLLALLACSRDDDPDSESCAPPVAPEIDIAGAVAGTREAEVVYPVPWTGEPRTIRVHTWYPTAETSGQGARWLGLFDDPNSIVEASFDPPSATCKAPLVVYSHGSQAWAGNGSPILRQLVAAGWVAAAPDHTDNLLTQNVDPRVETYPLLRTLDVRATIDWIEDLPTDDPLHGRVDTSRVFVFGHSYGGQTSWLLSGPDFDPAAVAARCEASSLGCTSEEQAAYEERSVDPRVVAVAPMAGSANADLVADEGWASMDRPVLYLTGSADNDGSEPFARASEGDVTWVELAGGCHETFTATSFDCEGVEKERGLGIVATYVAAFAVRHVLDSEDEAVIGTLDGSVEVDPIATLQRSRD